jgi:hypothetical protein
MPFHYKALIAIRKMKNVATQKIQTTPTARQTGIGAAQPAERWKFL